MGQLGTVGASWDVSDGTKMSKRDRCYIFNKQGVERSKGNISKYRNSNR